MKLALDLDDTLYNEYDFVLSGYAEVAKFYSDHFRINNNDIFDFMITWHEECGREGILESTFEYFAQAKSDRKITQEALLLYRNHKPKLELYPEARGILEKFWKSRLTLITDGNPIVQENKIKALGIGQFFHRVYTTWSYGIDKSKPSIYCFKLACDSLGKSLSEMVYVGDDPRKDFLALNRAGGITVRVKTGKYKDLNLPGHLEATYIIDSIDMLPGLLHTKNIVID